MIDLWRSKFSWLIVWRWVSGNSKKKVYLKPPDGFLLATFQSEETISQKYRFLAKFLKSAQNKQPAKWTMSDLGDWIEVLSQKTSIECQIFYDKITNKLIIIDVLSWKHPIFVSQVLNVS